MELRFVERPSVSMSLDDGTWTQPSCPARVLQQKWIVDTGVRTIAFEQPSGIVILLERKPDGDGLWAIGGEEWRDVPLVTTE